MGNSCVGDESTEATDSTLDYIVEKAILDKAKGRISEGNFDDLADQVNVIRGANDKLKCLIDNLPKETVSPESILSEVDKSIGGNKVE